ncbi:MAG TPA: hypothetical protein DDW71_00400 [Lactobacillus sp.]|nr:hypothetical protein [Lactobacillus sp.]
MALKYTEEYYASEVTKAKTKYNSALKTYNSNKKKEADYSAKIAKVKGKLSNSQQIKMGTVYASMLSSRSVLGTAEAKYTIAKSNLADYKKNQAAEKRKATLQLKKDIIAQMQVDKAGYWAAGRPFIIPKYPGTKNSYVFIDNISESETSTTDITTNSISPGQYVNHFTQTTPTQRQYDGKLGGTSVSEEPGLKKQLDMLKRWSMIGTEVEAHHGQRETDSAVLTSVASTFDAPRDNAVPISLTLQDVKWAQGNIKQTTKKNNTGKKPTTKGSRKKVKPKAGKYVTIKKGDTYWGYHLKYGTSVAKLRSWNGFKDRYLPIGKKVRVK